MTRLIWNNAGMAKGVMCMNNFVRIDFNSRALKVYIAVSFCVFCMGHAMGVHVKDRVDVVNLLVNQDNRSVLPESLFEVTLMESNMYSVVYKERKPIAPEEKVKIEELLGKGNSPTVRYVDSDDCRIGVMPPDIRSLYANIDAFCSTNGTDYFAASLNTNMIENGEYKRALLFVVTNTPPSLTTLKNSHPALQKLMAPEFIYKVCTADTNSIPDGASPARWF